MTTKEVLDGPSPATDASAAEHDAWAEVERQLFEEPVVRKPVHKPVRKPGSSPASRPPLLRVPQLPWKSLGGGVLVLAAALLCGWWFMRGGSSAPVCVRLTNATPDDPARTAALSADGQRVAWVHAGALHIRSLTERSDRATPLPEGMLVEQLIWIGEGETFVAAARMTAGFNAGLWRLTPGGGQPVLLREGAHSPALSPDSSRIAFVQQDALGNKSIWSIAPDGSRASPLLADDDHDYLHPAWSPDGQRLVFVRSSRELIDIKLMTAPTEDGEAVEIVADFDPDTGPAWLGERALVFARRDARGASLMKLELDSEWQPDGDPVELTHVDDVSRLERIQAGARGRRVSFVGVRSRVDVYVAALEERGLTTPQRLTAGRSDHWPVAWSAAGDSLVMNVETDRHSEIVLQPVTGAGEPVRIGEGRVWAVTAGGDLLYGASDTLTTRVLRLSKHGTPKLLGELPVPVIHSRSVFRCPDREAGAGCVLGLKERDVLYLHAYDPREASGKGRLLVEALRRDEVPEPARGAAPADFRAASRVLAGLEDA